MFVCCNLSIKYSNSDREIRESHLVRMATLLEVKSQKKITTELYIKVDKFMSGFELCWTVAN